MNGYSWLRLYNETRTDRKLDRLADDEYRTWIALLCFASEQPERGTIDADDRVLLAIEVARGDEELLARTLRQLIALRIMTDDGARIVVINFQKRNYDKPSDRPDATRERKQRQRERERAGAQVARDAESLTPLSRDVTRRHATEKIREDQRRSEESREESTGGDPPDPPAAPIGASVREGHSTLIGKAPKGKRANLPCPPIPDLIAGVSEWAARKMIDAATLEPQAERFRDWLTAKGETRKDYAAAFRNWLTSPYNQPQANTGSGRGGKLSINEAADEVMRRRRARQAGQAAPLDDYPGAIDVPFRMAQHDGGAR